MSFSRLSVFLALFVCSLVPALAQERDVWVAETQQDWRIDGLPLDAEADSGITTVKLLIEPPDLSFGQSPFLAELVCNAAALGNMKIYKDPACSIPVDWMQVLGYNEVYVDTATGEELMRIGCTDFDPMAVAGWRVLQTIALKPDGDQWQLRVRAVAPLVEEKNAEGDSMGMRALFWFEPANECPEPGERRITWAKRMLNIQHGSLISTFQETDEQGAKGKWQRASGKEPGAKGNEQEAKDEVVGEDFWEYWRGLLEKRLQTPLYDASNEVLISETIRPSMLYDYDTILNCFSDDTTMFSVLRSDLMYNVKNLALIQTWCWEPRRSRLSICTEAVGPLLNVHDDVGNLRFRKPLFIRRIRR